MTKEKTIEQHEEKCFHIDNDTLEWVFILVSWISTTLLGVFIGWSIWGLGK